jgi:hypothetical protein
MRYKVKKKPAGIKITIEVTQEEMDMVVKQTIKKTKKED